MVATTEELEVKQQGSTKSRKCGYPCTFVYASFGAIRLQRLHSNDPEVYIVAFARQRGTMEELTLVVARGLPEIMELLYGLPETYSNRQATRRGLCP